MHNSKRRNIISFNEFRRRARQTGSKPQNNKGGPVIMDILNEKIDCCGKDPKTALRELSDFRITLVNSGRPKNKILEKLGDKIAFYGDEAKRAFYLSLIGNKSLAISDVVAVEARAIFCNESLYCRMDPGRVVHDGSGWLNYEGIPPPRIEGAKKAALLNLKRLGVLKKK